MNLKCILKPILNYCLFDFRQAFDKLINSLRWQTLPGALKNPGIFRGKENKLVYNLNADNQNYHFYRLNY